jgi:ABC-type antimicrobial peptide transport system permease subunit
VSFRLLTDNIDRRLADYKTGAQVAFAGGSLALLLTACGVFGVFAHVVESRRREIGVRVALGAGKTQVLGMLFRTTRRVWLAGLAGGLLLSIGIGPVIGQYLYGVSPFDPIAFGGVAAILLLTACAATVIPARRALNVDPAVTLREDT